MDRFTVFLDLEKGQIDVDMALVSGSYIRYSIKATPDGIHLSSESPKSDLYRAPQGERLSLGNHKAQDWDLVCRRLDLKEILPTWKRLGELTPFSESNQGNDLLAEVARLIEQRDKDQRLHNSFAPISGRF
jgi:hypothetical protein